MKNLLTIIILSTFLMSGCQFFEKVFNKMEIEDTIPAWEAKQDSIKKAEAHKAKLIEEARLAKEKAIKDSLLRLQENRFHVIIGSFKVPTNADDFQNAVATMGFNNPRIVESNNGFRMVSVAAFDSYGKAFTEMMHINRGREEPIELWVFEAQF